MTFRFLPPSPDEGTGVRRFQIATVLAMAVIGGLLALPGNTAAPFLVGAMAALMLNFFRVQSPYDSRKKRAERGYVTLDSDALRIHDGKRETRLPWSDIEKLDASAGKLELVYKGGKTTLALREIENGMQLAQELGNRLVKPQVPSNFIPLSPR